jgi:hypothetical protein
MGVMHRPSAWPAERWLICLELQDIHAAHREAIDNARQLLAHARRNGWPVVHVHLRPMQGGGPAYRPVEGCEPRPSEPVFFRDGAATTPDHPFWRLARAAEGSQALLCGVVSDPWSVRSVEATDRIGVRLSLVREALAGVLPMGFTDKFDFMGLRQAMAAVRTPWLLEAANAP